MSPEPVHPLRVLSTEHVPPATLAPAARTLTWFGTDTAARYQREPHPCLDADGVSYRFNALGYRGEEWPSPRPPGAFTLLSVGASEVFGLGVPEEAAFPRLLAASIESLIGRPVLDINLGLCGGSMDYVARTLTSAISAVAPDVVVFVVPSPVRREHISDAGRMFLYPNAFSPDWISGLKNRIKYGLGDPENSRQNAAFDRLAGDANDALNCFKNYATCEMLCRRHGVMWVFSTFIENFLAPVRHLVDEAHHVTPGLADLRDMLLKQHGDPARCWARDMGHPGIEPHRLMAQNCLTKLQALYGTALERRPATTPHRAESAFASS